MSGRVEESTAVGRLRKDLSDALDGEVRFSGGDRALYATDASNYRHVPIGVVIPRHVDDIVETVAIARDHDVPLLMRGGGTSLAGQCCNAALVLDTSKYVHGVMEVDAARATARVLPGTYLDDLNAAALEHGLTFGPDPATHNHCTIGGMVGNDSCGVHSMASEFHGAGARTSDNVVSLEVLTYDGTRMRVGSTGEEDYRRIVAGGGRRAQIYSRLKELADRYGQAIRERFPRIQRRVSGYNLPTLLPENGFDLARALTGSESTCAVTLEAELRLIPAAAARVLVVVGYPSIYEAGDAVPMIREFEPLGLEGMDDVLTRYLHTKRLHADDLHLMPEGGGWLLVELGGDTREEASERAHGMAAALGRGPQASDIRVYEDPETQHRVWAMRESGLGATAFVPGEPDTWPGWEDSAVPVDRMGQYLRDLRSLLDRHGYECSLYGHFGQGCVHTRIDFDLVSKDGRQRFETFTREAAELVLRHGGSLSGEHGDGIARSDLLPLMFGRELVGAFEEFQAIWDPAGRMNPGRIVHPEVRTDHLRLAELADAADPPTRFAYAEDGGSFLHATTRCVGVGECRRNDGGIMCPSYMVLREEKHSTRGRAHLLNEMLHGTLLTDGWRSEEVRESLDLCLACKGCTGECPVNVDIPTYKAEFLSRYYEGRLRPRAAYAFGLIDVWARFASLAPSLVNAAAASPLIGRGMKRLANIAPERSLPRFGDRTFRQRFAKRTPRRWDGERVVLWPDTFNNHFHPEVLEAAVDVLESLGFTVSLPRAPVCCGRPLYDWGMLDRAESYLRRVMSILADELNAGTRVVGLEPSCVAVFRDELTSLIPGEDAVALKNSVCTLGELLEDRDLPSPPGETRVLLHGHCHQRAVLEFDADVSLLRTAFGNVDVLDSGCCGMAGAFGFEKEKYALSVAAGERVLLPAVRGAPADTLIVSDGFSCREQIAQQTSRAALHSVQALRLAWGRDVP